MVKVSSKFLFKSPGALQNRCGCTAPISKVRGIRWGKNHKKERSTGEKWDFTQKRVLSKNSKQNVFANLWKISYFLNKLVIFYQKIKSIESLCNNLVIFHLKLKTYVIFGRQKKRFRGEWVRSEQKRGVLRTPPSVPSNMGMSPGSISYYSLNFIEYLSVISIFATLAGGLSQVHTWTPWMPKQKWKSATISKSPKFWFLFVSTFKATSSKLFDWLKRFSYTNCLR